VLKRDINLPTNQHYQQNCFVIVQLVVARSVGLYRSLVISFIAVFIFRIRRHSKSLDVNAKVCGYCAAPFQLLYTNSKSQSTVPRTPNQFALFVKDNYASIKRSQPGMKHGDVMSAIKMQYQQSKSEKKPIAFHLDDV